MTKVPMNVSGSPSLQRLLNCLSNKSVCFLRDDYRCLFEQQAVLSDLHMLLSVPSIQRGLELFACLIIPSFCGVVVVFGSPCLKELSSEGLSRMKASYTKTGRTLESYSFLVTV
jgi:hypothetical protein